MANIKKIITLHNEITEALKSSLEKAILIGQLLIGQKEKLNHGEFTSWIKENLPFTDRTARNYIKLFNNKDMLITETVSDLKSAYRLLSEKNQDNTGKSFYQKVEEIESEPFDILAQITRNVDIKEMSGVALNIHNAFKMFPKRTEAIIKHTDHKEAYGYILETVTDKLIKKFDTSPHQNMYLELNLERLSYEASVWPMINNFFRNGASIYLAVVESITKEKLRGLYEELKHFVQKKHIIFAYGEPETILNDLNYKKSLMHFTRLGIMNFPDKGDGIQILQI